MRRIPNVSYTPGGVVTLLTFELPQGLWTPADETIGNTDKSATGVRVSYERRREPRMTVRPHFYESMWPDVRAWLAWAQRTGLAFSYDFDHEAPGNPYAFWVDLEKPALGERLEPRRVQQFPRVFDIELELRLVGAGEFHVPLP